MVFPFNQVKGNFARLYKALQDIKILFDEHLSCKSNEVVEQCWHQGMIDACRHFQRYVGNIPPVSIHFNE